jgi:hypothetical protein
MAVKSTLIKFIPWDFNSEFTRLEKGVWVSVKVMFINEKSWLDWVCRVINVLGASMNVQEFNAYEDFGQLSKVHREPLNLYFQNLAQVKILVRKEKGQFIIPNIRLIWRKWEERLKSF